MEKVIKNIFLLTLLLLVSYSAHSQDDKKKKTEEEDIFKEFSLTTFEDAAAVRIKDSSIMFQHLIGVKYGYGIPNVTFSNNKDHKSIKTYKNFGIYYTYFHTLWGSMPFFGLQTGISHSEIGYNHATEIAKDEFSYAEQRYSSIEIPVLSAFRVDFWKLRLMLNLGCFGSYIYSTNLPDGIPPTTKKYGYGAMGQLGVAVKLKPIELHLEGGYKFYLSYLYNPKIYSSEYWTYTHPNQIFMSVGLFYNFGSKRNNKK